MTEAVWRCHEGPDALADAVAGEVAAVIERALASRGETVLALPGGSTPRPTFRKLAQLPLAWERVTLIPTDDRLVEAGSPLSNARLIEESLGGTGARVVPIASEQTNVERAGQAADARLQELSWPPDLVWLGMGEDGHTASIFVGPDLEGALDAPGDRRAVGVRPDPLPAEAPVPRVTLTKASILAAQALLITITGDRKKALLEQALAEGEHSELPIGRVLAAREQPVTIHWSRA